MTSTTTTTILTEKEICQRFRVTPEEIDKATRFIDMQTGKAFYVVSSRSGGDDHHVRYDAEHKCLTCTCEAGKANKKCWARRAAMASALRDRQDKLTAAKEAAEQQGAAKYAELATQRDEAQALVANLKPGKNVRQARPFSILA